MMRCVSKDVTSVIRYGMLSALVKGWRVDDQKFWFPRHQRLAMLTGLNPNRMKWLPKWLILFSKYRLSEALMAVYKLFWDEFSSWYLEMIKPAYGAGHQPE